ncbi:cytochrome P450 [Rhizopogon salebrosus TDB-379]|nr:cytochrome P450 [Rhizopogon salebrosus TDB-379]
MAALTFVFLLLLLPFVILRSLLKKRDTKGLPLPPDPPHLSHVGNMIGVDADHPWSAYSRWEAEYGEIVSRLFSKDMVILNSDRVARELLDRRAHNYSTRTPLLNRVLDLFGFEFSSIFLPHSDRWRLHRRILHRVFFSEALPSFRRIQMRNTHDLVLNLLNSSGEYGSHLHTFSTSIIMSVVYDYTILPRDGPFITMADRSLEILVRVLKPKVAWIVGEFPILGKILSWFLGAGGVILQISLVSKAVGVPFEHVKNNMTSKLPSWFPGASSAMLQRSLVPEIVDIPLEHVADTAALSIIFDALLRVLEKAKYEYEVALLEKAVKEASATGCIAASGTTTSTLYVFLLAMVLYPEVQARAQEEIDFVIGKDLGRLPGWDDRASMPYVDAVIRETLRWFPVPPLGIPHRTLNDDIFEGSYIPKGAAVLTNIWSMARNPEKDFNPTKFMPEQHMSKVKPKGSPVHGPDDISFAFGFGRRACVGRYVEDASLFAAVVNILAVFKVQRAPGWNIGPDCNGVKWTAGVATYPVFPCIFTLRQAKERVVELITAQP